MRATTPIHPAGTPSRKGVYKLVGVVLLLLFAATAGAAFSLLSRFYGSTGLMQSLGSLGKTTTVLVDPRRFFPGKDRLTVLCLGLDRNILKSRNPKLNGMPYTKGARSDVLMVATLDLAQQSVSLLSIPRDTRVQLPGQAGWSKINEAHARGGIPYTRKAVEEFLGITLDHYVVIKQEAIEEVVSSLGGLQVKVAGDMDYDDNWGQLHIHLKEGEQVLSGPQVAGYLRYRRGPEGDFGRIRRQQQVVQVLADRVKDPSVLPKAWSLIRAIRQNVQTDLSPEQQLALAHLFHKIDTANLQTLSLPVVDTEMIGGVSYVLADDFRKSAAVEWLVQGNVEAMNRLVTVELRNASGSRELFDQVYECLRHYGFEVVRGGRERSEPAAATRVMQRTKLRGAGRRLLDVLGLRGSVERSEESGYDVTLYVGKDLETSPAVASPELWPEIPERPAPQRRFRRPHRSRESLEIQVEAVEQPAESEAAAAPAGRPMGELDVPGAADPAPPAEEGGVTPAAPPAPDTEEGAAAAPAADSQTGG